MAAVLFKVECAVRLGYTSPTSQACQWNSSFCSKVHVHFLPVKHASNILLLILLHKLLD